VRIPAPGRRAGREHIRKGARAPFLALGIGVDPATIVHWLGEIARHEIELERVRATIAQSQSQFHQAHDRLREDEDEVDAAARRLQECSALIRGSEREIQDLAAKVARLRAQQDQIKDNRAYRTLSEEIAACTVQIEAKETEVLNQLERLEAGQKRHAADRSKLQDRRDQAGKKRVAMEEAVAAAEARQRELQQEIATCSEQLPDDILTRLIRMRAKMPLPVVALADQACGGCHAQFPTQVALRIAGGEAVVRCQACGRYVVA
jgi:predicted  nucleic acid-binding Zn-ribbon protein